MLFWYHFFDDWWFPYFSGSSLAQVVCMCISESILLLLVCLFHPGSSMWLFCEIDDHKTDIRERPYEIGYSIKWVCFDRNIYWSHCGSLEISEDKICLCEKVVNMSHIHCGDHDFSACRATFRENIISPTAIKFVSLYEGFSPIPHLIWAANEGFPTQSIIEDDKCCDTDKKCCYW